MSHLKIVNIFLEETDTFRLHCDAVKGRLINKTITHLTEGKNKKSLIVLQYIQEKKCTYVVFTFNVLPYSYINADLS